MGFEPILITSEWGNSDLLSSRDRTSPCAEPPRRTAESAAGLIQITSKCLESRAGIAPASAVLQTAACAARPTGLPPVSQIVSIETGQEAGIRTRTVSFTGRDAAVTPQS